MPIPVSQFGLQTLESVPDTLYPSPFIPPDTLSLDPMAGLGIAAEIRTLGNMQRGVAAGCHRRIAISADPGAAKFV